MTGERAPWPLVVASLALLIVSSIIWIVIWILSGRPPSAEWFASVSAGLAVLAVGGIWASYLAAGQIRASIERITRAVGGSASLMRIAFRTRIDDAYYNDPGSRADGHRFHARLAEELRTSETRSVC